LEGRSLQLPWLILAAAAGALIPVQTLVNKRMQISVVQPLYSTMVNFGVGTILLGIMLALVPAANAGGRVKGLAEAPWWAWTGGALGVFFVTVAVVVVPKIGNATLVLALFTGQMLGALVLDHFGLLGSATREINGERLLAIGLLAVAVWLHRSHHRLGAFAPRLEEPGSVARSRPAPGGRRSARQARRDSRKRMLEQLRGVHPAGADLAVRAGNRIQAAGATR
jgi:transporter family-2 protein